MDTASCTEGRQCETQKVSRVKTEAETGVTQLQAKEREGLSAITAARREWAAQILPESSPKKPTL